MTLLELQNKINSTVECVREEGQDPDDIPVTLQLGTGMKDWWGCDEMSVEWDNNTQATGCVIVAALDGES